MTVCCVRKAGAHVLRLVLIGIGISEMMWAATREWTSIGPEGGAILRLAVELRNPSTIYAGTCTGVFKTADGGATWTAVNSGLLAPDCFAVMEIDPQNPDTVYTASKQGVFKTTDGGHSWHAINSGNGIFFQLETIGCPTTCTQPVAIDPATPAILYAAASQVFGSDRSVMRGILKSTDAGATWTLVNPGNFNVIAVDPHDGTVYASGYNSNAGLFKSSDGGASWSQIAAQRSPIAGVTMHPQLSGTLYYWTGGQSWGEIQ